MENNNKEESREFYVYKHVRLDNNTCFYIGKGKNGRKDDPNRNPTHDSICKRHEYKVVIFKNKLNEAEAFKLEEDLIRCYVFKMGYGICIKGYMNNNNKFLTNRTFGGEGTSGYKHSEETKKKIGEASSERNKGKKASEETKQRMSEKKKGTIPWNKGKKGIQAGEKNPMYGLHHSEEAKRKNSKAHKGKPAPNRSKVICITTGKIFDCIKDASDNYNVAHSNISYCCMGKRNYAGEVQDGTKLQWKYVKDYNNEFKGILINPIINK